MPTLVLDVSTPNPLKMQFVFSEGKRHLAYVDEDAPDDGEPFVYLDPNREEPHVKVHCQTYSILDPPYYLIGAESGTPFGTVQYVGPKEEREYGIFRPLDFRVTDLSEMTEFVWREQTPKEQLRSLPVRRAEISQRGTACGMARLVLGSPELIPGRHAQLRLDYRQSVSELNALLHLAAFAFMLTRYYGLHGR